MRRLTFACLTLGLFILAASATAQPRPGQGGRFGGGDNAAALLQMKEVRAELKVTDEQVEKIQSQSKEMQTKMREQFGNLKDLPEDERKTKFTEMMKANRDASKKILDGVLNADQTKRLNQLVLQRAGIASVADNEETAKALGVTDEQKEKIKAINDEFRKDLRELFQPGGDQKEGFAKMTALRKEVTEKITGVMTDEQKKKWDDLTGAKFEFPAFQPMRRPMLKNKTDN